METISWLVEQVFIMFLLAGIGCICFRTGKITMEGSRNLGNILIYLSLPCVIINSFLTEYSTEKMHGFFYSSLAALVILLVSMLISRVFFKRNGVLAFASTFSNPGFFGIPLIVSIISEEAVFLLHRLLFLSIYFSGLMVLI